MMRNKFVVLAIFMTGLLCAACNSNVVFENTIVMDKATWSKENVAVFPFTPRDTSTVYDVILKVKNNDNYAYSNLYVFNEIRFPNKQFMRDTIELFLADVEGEWTGESWFSTHTNTFNFKKGIQFPYNGEYFFSLEQAMRCTNKNCSVSGIESITMQIIERK